MDSMACLPFMKPNRPPQVAAGLSESHPASTAIFTLVSADLDGQGMVVDFQTVRETVGRWIDQELDHRMILHRDDPAVAALRDLGEPLVLVDFHPTAVILDARGFKVQLLDIYRAPHRHQKMRAVETPPVLSLNSNVSGLARNL